jgi:glycosyltransferase domain-containing protein
MNFKGTVMLTVVIPSYNHQKYIRDCLLSACSINVKGLKILVIDDGSTDSTVRVVEDFIENQITVRVELLKKENSGLVSSLNLALSRVTTEYMYICASDDIPVPEGINRCLEVLSKEKKCSFIIGGAKKFTNKHDSRNVYGEHHKYFFALPPDRRYKMCFFNYPSPILIQSTVFRTQAIKNIGGWDTKLRLDDYPLFIDLLKSCPKNESDFRYLPDITTVSYRQHPNNSYKNTLRQFELVSQAIKSRAPIHLTRRSLANCAASYMVTSVNNNRWRDFWAIFYSVNLEEKFMIFGYLPFQIILKIKRRIQSY